MTPQDIYESFLVNHNLVWNQIARFTFDGAAPCTEETPVDFCPQNEEQKSILKSKYSADRLYVAKENITSTSLHNLSAVKGTLVAVIKKQHPMGDSTLWFVDNGNAQGFVPRRSLELVSRVSIQPNRTTSQSSIGTNAVAASTPDLMSLNSPEKVIARSSSSNSQTNWYSNLDTDHDENICSSNIDSFNQPQRYQNVQPEVRLFSTFFIPFFF